MRARILSAAVLSAALTLGTHPAAAQEGARTTLVQIDPATPDRAEAAIAAIRSDIHQTGPHGVIQLRVGTGDVRGVRIVATDAANRPLLAVYHREGQRTPTLSPESTATSGVLHLLDTILYDHAPLSPAELEARIQRHHRYKELLARVRTLLEEGASYQSDAKAQDLIRTIAAHVYRTRHITLPTSGEPRH